VARERFLVVIKSGVGNGTIHLFVLPKKNDFFFRELSFDKRDGFPRLQNTMFSFTGDDINLVIGYVGTIFSDIKLLFFILVGLPIGFYIVDRIIGTLFSSKSEEK